MINSLDSNNQFIYLTASRDHALHILENPKYKPSVSMSETSPSFVEWSDPEEESTEYSDYGNNQHEEDDELSADASSGEAGIVEDEMTAIHRKLQAESSDTRRLDLGYALLEGKSLKTIQIASMAMLFKSEYKRLEFVKFATYFASDQEYLPILEDLFTYESIRKDFRKHAANLKD